MFVMIEKPSISFGYCYLSKKGISVCIVSDEVSLEALIGHEWDLVASVETVAKSLPETVQGPNIIVSSIRRVASEQKQVEATD